MPYFMSEQDGQYCVMKGIEGESGEKVKCHPSKEDAKAHLAALMINVEDAKSTDDESSKGGPGSGWKAPPLGSHDAANAPNFAGGPGAQGPKVRGSAVDDSDGKGQEEEEEEKPETQRCKCPKCGNVVVLPKGKSCRDIQCAACKDTFMRDEKKPPKEVKPEGEPGEHGKKPKQEYEKSMDNPSYNTIHGDGGMLSKATSDGEQESGCKCPKCGTSVSCDTEKCPKCGTMIQEEVTSDDKRDDTLTAFKVYQQKNGAWRWVAVSSVAIRDKEGEIVSTKAYDDAIRYAEETGDYGQLDLVHVNGTDVGSCDFMQVTNNMLVEGGTWYDTPLANRVREKVQSKQDYWGVSLKFKYNPALKQDGIYTGDIRILKRTVLPRTMAASYGTAFVSVGGSEMAKSIDDQAKGALKEMGLEDAEIEDLASKQKMLPENVVEKSETGEIEKEEPDEVKAISLLDQIKSLLRIKPKETPVAPVQEEAGKAKEVDSPAESVEPTEQKKAEVSETDPVVTVKMLQATSIEVARSIATNMQKALDERDEAIKAMAKEIGELRAELDHSIEDRVDERLRNLPPVVKVAASQVQATVDPTVKPVEQLTADKRLVADIIGTIDKYHTEQKYKA